MEAEALTPDIRQRYKKLAASAQASAVDKAWAQEKLDADEHMRTRFAEAARSPNTSPEDKKWALGKLGTSWPDEGLPLTAEQKGKVARETAAGQTEAPTFGDKLGAAGKGAVAGARAGMLGAADTFSMGLIPKALQATGVIDAGTRERLNQETQAPSDTVMASLPTSEHLGNFSGGVASALVGPGRQLARPAQGLLGVMERRLPAVAEKFLPRLAGQAVSGGVSGGLYGATDAAVRGNDIGKGALSGAEGGAEWGAGLGLLGAGAKGLFGAIKNSRGGQAREYLNQQGVDVGPTTPGKGGPIDNELAGVSPGKAGLGEAERKGAVGVLKPLEETYDTGVAKPHAAERARIAASPEGQAPRDITPLLNDLEALQKSGKLLPGEASTVNSILDRYRTMAIPEEAPQRMPVVGPRMPSPGEPSSNPVVGERMPGRPDASRSPVVGERMPGRPGQSASPEVGARSPQTPLRGYPGEAPEFRPKDWGPSAGAGGREFRPQSFQTPNETAPEFAPRGFRMPGETGPEFTPKAWGPAAKPPATPRVTEAQLNDIRQALGRASDVGSTGNQSVPKAELDDVRRSAKALVDQGPFAKTNEAYAKGTADYERARQLLGLEKDVSGVRSPEGPAEGDVMGLAERLSQRAKGTEVGGRQGTGIDQFGKENPQFGRSLELPKILQKRADLEFKGPSGAGGALSDLGLPLIAGYGAQALGGGHGIAAASLMAALAMGARNATPLAGRMLYGPAQGAAGLADQMAPRIPAFVPEIEQIIANVRAREAKKTQPPKQQRR